MGRKYAIRKCPNCCPDGGACMTYTYDASGAPAWKCQNCNREFPRIVRKRGTTETGRQTRTLEAIERKGYVAERRQLIGDKLFVAMVKGTGLAEDRLIGTIGPRGKIVLEKYSFGCSGRKLTSLTEIY